MKLFVIAALVAVAAAGRLEHLERSYLPPDNSIGAGSNGGFGSPSAHGSFGANSGAFGAAGAGQRGHSAGASFPGATSNQYLPPNHGPASNGVQQFGGSLHGFGGQKFRSQQYSGHQAAPAQQYASPSSQYAAPSSQYAPRSSQYTAPSSQYAAPSSQYAAPSSQYAAPSSQYRSPQAGSSFGASSHQGQYSQQSGATSRQYLAPKTSSSQNYPQQAFDEQTGYHY